MTNFVKINKAKYREREIQILKIIFAQFPNGRIPVIEETSPCTAKKR